MRTAQLTHQRLGITRNLVRAALRAHPRMHALPRNTMPGGDLGDRAPGLNLQHAPALRYRLTESAPTGEWTTTITARTGGRERGWSWVKSTHHLTSRETA